MPPSPRTRSRSAADGGGGRAEPLLWGCFHARFIHWDLLIPQWGSSSAHPTPPKILFRDGGNRALPSPGHPCACSCSPRPGPTPAAPPATPAGKALEGARIWGCLSLPPKHREHPPEQSTKPRGLAGTATANPRARVERGREPGMAVSCQAAPTPCPRHSGGSQGGPPHPKTGFSTREKVKEVNPSPKVDLGHPQPERKARGGVGGTRSAVPKLS